MTTTQVSISVRVNDQNVNLVVSAAETLLDVLRDRLHLTGTRRNCEQGECGACTVLLDGVAVNSCLVFASSVHGHSVTTVEGLDRDGALDPVQKAFLAADASQCGYCTSGLLMSAKGLLAEHPQPTRAEIREGLAGNYCRCTGYKASVEALLGASGGQGDSDDWTHSRHHIEASTIYVADMSVPDMLHGALVTIPLAHAEIDGVDVARAVGMPEVVRVFTAADFAGVRHSALRPHRARPTRPRIGPDALRGRTGRPRRCQHGAGGARRGQTGRRGVPPPAADHDTRSGPLRRPHP